MKKYIRLFSGGIPMLTANVWRLRKYSFKPEKYDVRVKYAKIRKFLLSICADMRCRIIVTGLENIPQGTNVLFVSNHQSNADPLTLIAILKDPIAFLAKKEAKKFIYVGTIIKALDSVFIDRDDIRAEIKSIRLLSDRLTKIPEQSFVIYPEGTRSRDPEHQVADFKPGALKPAFLTGKPIVPVAVFGTFRCLDRKFEMKRFPVQIAFLKPIMPEELKKTNTVELAKKVQAEITEQVDLLRERDVGLVADGGVQTPNLPIYFKGL
jgi:1-acyl-sn-glycerol-3-phosphate acyltransferase